MLLEIINSSLTYTLHVNPHFVYSLLYQREIFTPYHGRPGFIDLVNNIEMVREEEGERECVFLLDDHFKTLTDCVLLICVGYYIFCK